MSGIMPLTRELGVILDREPIPELEPITVRPLRCTRHDLWTPEALAEMNRIWNGETE